MEVKSGVFIIDLIIYNILHKAYNEHCGRIRSDDQIISLAPALVYKLGNVGFKKTALQCGDMWKNNLAKMLICERFGLKKISVMSKHTFVVSVTL